MPDSMGNTLFSCMVYTALRPHKTSESGMRKTMLATLRMDITLPGSIHMPKTAACWNTSRLTSKICCKKKMNTLLHFRIKKLGSRCGCFPFFINQTDLEICGYEGNMCFEEELR